MVRIFVVEDDADLNRVVSNSLRNAGYEVVSCYNGVEALEKMDEEKCDLLLTDIMMPRMNGFELAESVRSTDKTTPIIFMTNHSFLHTSFTSPTTEILPVSCFSKRRMG